MPYNPQTHRRRSIRLRDYDYSQVGAYFVTLCTHNRACLFGDVVDGKMWVNKFGAVVEESWTWLAEQYEYVALDEWVVMPNHMHGIIWIVDDPGRGGSRTAPTMERKPLGRLIGAFKTVSTKRINEMNGMPGAAVWQRNYYEHIIRSEGELNRIRRYIDANPLQWERDENNPAHIGRR